MRTRTVRGTSGDAGKTFSAASQESNEPRTEENLKRAVQKGRSCRRQAPEFVADQLVTRPVAPSGRQRRLPAIAVEINLDRVFVVECLGKGPGIVSGETVIPARYIRSVSAVILPMTNAGCCRTGRGGHASLNEEPGNNRGDSRKTGRAAGSWAETAHSSARVRLSTQLCGPRGGRQ